MLEAQLTSDSKTDVRLAAVSAIGQVAETNDPEAIESCRPASAIEVGPSHRQPPGSSWKGLVKGTSSEMLSPVFLCWPLSPVQAAIDLAQVSVKGEAQTVALLETQLTSDSKKAVRLAAVIAIGQVTETNDPEAIVSCRPASAIEV